MIRIAILAGLSCLTIPIQLPGQEFKINRITHGPILGRLSAHGIGIWVRTERPGRFQVEYWPSPFGREITVSRLQTTSWESDNTGWIHLKDLKANTKYNYRVILPNSKASKSGTFHTLPDSKLMKNPKLNPKGLFNFSFEYACGNNQNKGHSIGPSLPAFKTMLKKLKDKIDFAILNGDWLYENSREHQVKDWMKQVGIKSEKDLPKVVKVAPTMVGVWENYKVFLEKGKNLAEWHRHIPSFFTYDDHEILNDVWGAGEPGITERRAVFRDIGVKPWYDYLAWSNPTKFTQPVFFGKAKVKAGSDILVDPDADFSKLDLSQAGTLHIHWGTPTAGVNENELDDQPPAEKNAGVYGIAKILDKHQLKIHPTPKHSSKVSYSIGRRSYFHKRISNCDFFFLDTRGHREMHDLERRDKPGISILGKDQKKWLKDGIKKSDADFIFVISSVNLMIPHVGGGKVRPENKDDSWAVFLQERDELIKFWDGVKQPVFVLTGDLHNSFAIQIADNVWEFASGPHNSNNHIVSDEGGRPANGPFDSFGRKCNILWSTYYLNDVPRDQLQHPNYCVVQVNNVFNSPKKVDEKRWVAFPRPHVVFQYYDGRTGDLKYAQSIPAR